MPSKQYKCSKYTLYLEKIVSMLEDPGRYGEILRWSREGRAFQVLDPVRLVTEALPTRGGRVCKYVSFKKQMNNYGFASRDDEFSHIHFNRANPKGAKLDYHVCRDERSKPVRAAAKGPKGLASDPLALAPEFAFFNDLNTRCLCLLATGSDCDRNCDFDWTEPLPGVF